MPSNTSNLMVARTYLEDLKSFTDIAAPRLLIMGISRGGRGGEGGRGGGGGGGCVSFSYA